MNFNLFISRRISHQSHRPFTRVIIRLALIAVSLSIAIMLISDAIVIGFQNEVKNKITSFESHIQISKTRTNFTFDQEPIMYDSSLVADIAAIPEVSHVQTYGTKAGIISTGEEIEGVVIKGITQDYGWSNIENRIVRGSKFELNDSVISNKMLISKILADRLSLDTGMDIIMYFVQEPVRYRKFTISGIYNTSIEEIDKIFVLADMRHIQVLNDWHESQIGGYEIFLKGRHGEPADKNGEELFTLGFSGFGNLEEVTNQIRYMLDVDKDALSVKERYPQLFDWLELLNVNVEVILTLMALVAAINMITALIIMILERTQMIGILKALGSKDKQIRRIFMYTALRLILTGLVVGNIMALGLLLVQKYFKPFKLEEATYYLSEVPVELNIIHILVINLLAFIFTAIAMLLPSLMVVRVRPVKAIRFE